MAEEEGIVGSPEKLRTPEENREIALAIIGLYREEGRKLVLREEEGAVLQQEELRNQGVHEGWLDYTGVEDKGRTEGQVSMMFSSFPQMDVWAKTELPEDVQTGGVKGKAYAFLRGVVRRAEAATHSFLSAIRFDAAPNAYDSKKDIFNAGVVQPMYKEKNDIERDALAQRRKLRWDQWKSDVTVALLNDITRRL